MRVLAGYCYLLAALAIMHHLAVDDPSIKLTVCVAVLLMLCGKILSWLSSLWQQRRRNRRAGALLNDVLNHKKAGDNTETVLFLRPFSTTGRLTVANPKRRRLPILPSYFARENTLEFETLLSEALEPGLSLIALGRPGEHIGAGRIIASDSDWKDVFQRLALHTRWIVLIPSDEGETRWEVEWLVSHGLLNKVVFLMPPQLRPGGIDIQEYWNRVRDGLKSAAVDLPAYTPAGQFLRLGAGGRFFRSRYLPILTVRQLNNTFYAITRPLRRGALSWPTESFGSPSGH